VASAQSKFRILQVRIKPEDETVRVAVEYGLTEIVKTIMPNQGVVRLSAIFNDKGDLADVELITDRIQ
jgi:hypothetical protein